MGSILSRANEIIEEYGSVENYLKANSPTILQTREMNFKTFNVTDQNIEVCVHRDRNDEGEEYVLITAFIPEGEEEQDRLEEDTVTFTSDSLIKEFIYDFSAQSAENFVKSKTSIRY